MCILVDIHFGRYFKDQISGQISQDRWFSGHMPRVVFFQFIRHIWCLVQFDDFHKYFVNKNLTPYSGDKHYLSL